MNTPLMSRSTRMRLLVVPMLVGLVAAGCTVGPNYKRPPAAAPDTFRGAPAGQPSTSPSIADGRWSQVFQDQPLQALDHDGAGRELRRAHCRVADSPG